MSGIPSDLGKSKRQGSFLYSYLLSWKQCAGTRTALRYRTTRPSSNSPRQIRYRLEYVVRVPLYRIVTDLRVQDLEEQKRTKYKINGTATITAIEKSNPNLTGSLLVLVRITRSVLSLVRFFNNEQNILYSMSPIQAGGQGVKSGGGTRLGGCYGQVVRDVDAPVGLRVFDKPTSES